MNQFHTEYEARCSRPSDIHEHLPRLHAEAATGNAIVLELGVRSGNSTAAFVAAVTEHGGHVHSVDLYPVPPFPPPPDWGSTGQWTFWEGDDMLLAPDLPNDVDVLFIDTSHHYTQTRAELDVYVPKVRAGGVVLLHDTELERPEGTPPSDPAFPVRVAVDEYCAAHNLTPEYVTGCYGLGVIRIPKGE